MMIKVEEVINELIKPIPEPEKTVDTLIVGEKDKVVKGIGTTFMATYDVIQRAIDLGVNLIITHEGIYYSHHDQTDKWIQDPIYLEKRRLIESSDMAIFRLHDAIHLYKPDGITKGLLHSLDWGCYVEKNDLTESILTLPAMTLGEFAEYVKKKLNIPYVRVVGDVSQICKRVAVSVGYRGGGENAIPLFVREQLDLLITGEGPEWETPEYVRDAVQQGRKRALIFLGHAESEKAGMRYLAKKLKSVYPTIPVHFLDEKPVFQII
ncbi:hypothetical protein J8TS2_13530 [Lederbergia ruris]|uniref:GTP cyclohydrolase 1 type 2 homolog n=1 Tax=Lederbergia ruris TaxID=217495 RepID=A0ABQ4KGD7_9BACI|nr:Nif3-like dinuclear metal center hexameric protein [Lederbergia ruris]GIN57034.1 hypothetical protein J8TS2_13530 [Lederbergia ruris]